MIEICYTTSQPYYIFLNEKVYGHKLQHGKMIAELAGISFKTYCYLAHKCGGYINCVKFDVEFDDEDKCKKFAELIEEKYRRDIANRWYFYKRI